MYRRTLCRTVDEVNHSFPVLLVTGPRQVGKTTLLEMCSEKGRGYVTLDDLDLRNLAINDPGLFLQKFPAPLLIDEVQYAPQLFSYIKIKVDKEKKKGMYWLTGSQKFHLMKGISESLAGRVAIIDLLGFARSELDNRKGSCLPFIPESKWINAARQRKKDPTSLQDAYHQIWQGSFPQVNVDRKPSTRQRFFSSYIQTYLQRDVRDILGVSNETVFHNFLCAVAARSGQMLNYADLARDAAIDNKTAKSWLSVLETSGLVYLLKPYYRNVTKRLIKTPKLYFLDTGLCSYLTKWPDSQSLEAGAMSGAILETYLFSEILKSYWHNGLDAPFFFYRDTDQKEVDLVIEQGDTLYPVEFKKTATPSITATKHFKVLEKLDKKVGDGAVICFVEKDIPLSETVTAIPVKYL
jgi:uncharacterized protein